MKRFFFYLMIIYLFNISVFSGVYAENPCKTGASALGNAYIRANPLYTYYYGNLEAYVTNNRQHFVKGADSIKCAEMLSKVLMSNAVNSYNPDLLRDKREIDEKLRNTGIIIDNSAQPTLSQQLYTMAIQLNRLARVLPSAANGNYQPYRTSTTELEQMQMAAANLLMIFMQDPMLAENFRVIEPLIKEAANLEYQMIIEMGNRLMNK